MSLLAQIIAGEAQSGNNADSFGVAATIYNRSNSAVSGYTGPGAGLSPLGVATAKNQFEAYGAGRLGTPNAYQQSLADSLENGTFTSMGDPGNATYYNGAGGSSYGAYASGSGNNYGPGSNIYSNQYGKPPDANFVLPQAGAPSTATTHPDGPSDSPAYDPNGGLFDPHSNVGATPGGAPDGTSTTGAGSFAPGGDPTADGSALSVPTSLTALTPQSSTEAPVSGDLTQFQVAGVNAPASAGTSTAPAPTGTAPNALGGNGAGGGAPIDITNAPQIGDQAAGTIAQGATTAANTVSKSVDNAGKAITGAEGSAAAAGTSWLGSIFSAGTNLLVRGGFILIGLVILIGAFAFFYAEQSKPGVAVE